MQGRTGAAKQKQSFNPCAPSSDTVLLPPPVNETEFRRKRHRDSVDVKPVPATTHQRVLLEDGSPSRLEFVSLPALTQRACSQAQIPARLLRRAANCLEVHHQVLWPRRRTGRVRKHRFRTQRACLQAQIPDSESVLADSESVLASTDSRAFVASRCKLP